MPGFRNKQHRSQRSFGQSGDRKEMHRVTCDACGKKCEVPFKPTGSKPVKCSNCFRKSGGGSKNIEIPDYSKEFKRIEQRFDDLNEKLEKLFTLLGGE